MNKKNNKFVKILATVVLVLALIWCLGRYGWKLFGFNVTMPARIDEITVTDDNVHIEGGSVNFIPKGCIGYITKREGNDLYIGLRFSSVFGFFETGNFEIDIPTDEKIENVYLRTNEGNTLIWSLEDIAE